MDNATEDKVCSELAKSFSELKTVEERGRVLGRFISLAFNNFSPKETGKACAEQIARHSHHTLQQNIMQGVICFLQVMGDNTDVDIRNMEAVEAAGIAYKALEENDKTSLPMI